MIIHHSSFRLISIALVSAIMSAQICKANIHIKATIANHNEESSLDSIGNIGLIVGTVGLATYGLVKLGTWLFNKSDQTIVEQADNDLREASSRYTPILKLLSNAQQNYIDHKEYITISDEQLLYKIAQEKYHDADITIYLKRLNAVIKSMHKHAKIIQERIQYLQSQQESLDYESLKLITKMRPLEKQIRSLLPALTFTSEYLLYHKLYFISFEKEDALLYRYERDLDAIDSYQGNMNYLQNAIHQSVMIHERRHHNTYPYHWYVERIEDDMSAMRTTINNIMYRYPHRNNAAAQLCDKLELIRDTLLGSPYYAQELRDYEHAKITQAAIEAQQNQARAQEKQAYEMQRHNDLEIKRLHTTHNHNNCCTCCDTGD